MIFIPKKKSRKIWKKIVDDSQEELKKQIDKSFEEYKKAQHFKDSY